MKRTTMMTSVDLPFELRRSIDDLRQARARATEGAPPTMRAIIIEAVVKLLASEPRFTT